MYKCTRHQHLLMFASQKPGPGPAPVRGARRRAPEVLRGAAVAVDRSRRKRNAQLTGHCPAISR